MRAHHLALVLILAACGGAPPATSTRTPDAPQPREHRASTVPTSPRTLARDATFADLVAAARTLDDRRDQESDAACLIGVTPSGFELRADLAVAVRPLAEPEGDLDARLANDPGPVRVLTRYGSYGTGAAQMGLVATSTTLPPTRGTALALFVTPEGVYTRRSDQPGGERDASRVAWVVEHTDWSAFDLVVVTAEARVPLTTLVALLEALPASLAGRITLAVPLAAGTRLPDAPPAVDGTAERGQLCPDGLPELTEDAALGDLPASSIRAALAPLQSSAELCVGTSSGPGAAGGRVALAVRIAPDGRVSDACVMEDSTGDAALRACLSRAALELAFDAPSGYVDFALPLVLEPGRAQRQVAVCR
ncbi:hypothetical protein [Sandaracinus amylolyticus]|uniref:TonB C-terminal domain-containing protein n=1 Tax=Sandaracinus amylolyticus TaxID=927083 RepID=A0A0F6W227_9BACT|nr:hypothetical protein [Sandaracinus amylolyticus]AKF05423.1 hypothetical protein DB32_002572 [Sandaracinus amylolyticus]